MEEIEGACTWSPKMGGEEGESGMGTPERRLEEFLVQIRTDLDRTVRFWLKHSHDVQCGGFFTCLGEDGHMYDDTKYVWLQCRQVWMYARLYNEVDRFKTAEILEAAESGARFLLSHVKRPDGTWKCYFSLNRQGQPLKTQRSIFSEVFYCLAMGELTTATGNAQYSSEAAGMLNQIIHWVRHDDTALGREKLAGQPSVSCLNVPMMLLYVIMETTRRDPSLTSQYEESAKWCVDEILKHVQRNGTVVLENVTTDGREMPGCMGRLVNPGHAIEAGWFLLQRAESTNDAALRQQAMDVFIRDSFTRGWDHQQHGGGLLYFMDVDGESPVQLEWDMKLWWPHTEALVATLMAYTLSKDSHMLDKFTAVYDYVYSHFVDKIDGEWFGYLNRQGELTHRFKGGPWKGFFHVPRCLLMCEQMLEKLITERNKE